MAELEVQPKKRSSLPLILLGILVLAGVFFLVRSCNNQTVATTTPDADAWEDVDFNSPPADYPEVNDPNVSVRGDKNYGIYSLGENILFNTGESTLKTEAQENLKHVSASIEQRYKDAKIRVYGYTDSVGSADYNKELAEARAQSVADWLIENGGIDKKNVSLEPVGEKRPVATNESSAGREQNRRVEIVVKGKKNKTDS